MASTSAVRSCVEADHGVANDCGLSMRSLSADEQTYRSENYTP